MLGLSGGLQVFPHLDGKNPQIFTMARTVSALQLSCQKTHSDCGQEMSLVGPPRAPLWDTPLATLYSSCCLGKTCPCF